MFLSNRDIQHAIQTRQLLVTPPPEEFGAGYDETSIDLHLDAVEEAKVWNVALFQRRQSRQGWRDRNSIWEASTTPSSAKST
jgi:hypothetical protein